jgi:hypothetical protein
MDYDIRLRNYRLDPSDENARLLANAVSRIRDPKFTCLEKFKDLQEFLNFLTSDEVKIEFDEGDDGPEIVFNFKKAICMALKDVARNIFADDSSSYSRMIDVYMIPFPITAIMYNYEEVERYIVDSDNLVLFMNFRFTLEVNQLKLELDHYPEDSSYWQIARQITDHMEEHNLFDETLWEA